MQCKKTCPSNACATYDKRTLLQLGIATALATGMLAATSAADARTTKIEITSRAIAFGGHSFAGVGQYEKITGIATGEVDPNNPLNAVITDIEIAPRERRRVASSTSTISTS